MLPYLLQTKSVDIMARDFHYDLIKVSDYVQVVNKPIHHDVVRILIDKNVIDFHVNP